MDYYQTSYSYPYNLSGTLERTTKIQGLVDRKTGRPSKMLSNSIELYKGDNRMIRVYVKDENLDIINLNGAEARFILAETSSSSSYIIRKTTLNFQQGVILTPEKGEVVFFLNENDTKDLEATQYFYQVVIILSNGLRYTVCQGIVMLRKNLEYGESIPVNPDAVDTVDIPADSDYVTVYTSPQEIIIPTLRAPNANVDNISITNLVYGSGFVKIYFSAKILETGWKVSYITVTI